MKKINSIHFGGRVIGIGLAVMLLIPGVLLGINYFLHYRLLEILAGGCFALGAVILLGFVLILRTELKQDKKIEQYYGKHKNVKIKLSGGRYECGACGNRAVAEEHTHCSVCGCKYEAEPDRTPQEILKRRDER